MCFSLSVSRACLVICKSVRPAKKWYEMGVCISWLCPFNHSQPCQQSVFSPTETCIRIWCTAGTVERCYQRLVSTGFPPFPSLAIFSPFFEHRAWRSSTWESLPLWGLLGICQPVVKWGGIGWAGDWCCLWKCEDWWLSTSQFIGCWGSLASPWECNRACSQANRDTVEYAFRERDESKPGIKTLLPFLKNIMEESDLGNFQDLIVAFDACYWLAIDFNRF